MSCMSCLRGVCVYVLIWLGFHYVSLFLKKKYSPITINIRSKMQLGVPSCVNETKRPKVMYHNQESSEVELGGKF